MVATEIEHGTRSPCRPVWLRRGSTPAEDDRRREERARGASGVGGRVMLSLLLLPRRPLSWLEGLYSGRTVMIGGVMRGTRQSQNSCSGHLPATVMYESTLGRFGRENSLARQAG